jgi:hypothetical protein
MQGGVIDEVKFRNKWIGRDIERRKANANPKLRVLLDCLAVIEIFNVTVIYSKGTQILSISSPQPPPSSRAIYFPGKSARPISIHH